MPDALISLYGDGHANATRTRECVAMPGVRNQVVLTPACAVDGLNVFWPQGVGYDPCHAPESLIKAEKWTRTRGLLDPFLPRTFCNPPYGTSLLDPENELWPWLIELHIREMAKQAKTKAKFPPGLPLKKCNLSHWFERQLLNPQGESIMLVPNRTHRKWFRSWKKQMHGLMELDPLKFHDQKQAAPFPMVLGLHLGPTPVMSRVQEFYDAFAHLGDPG